MLSTVLYNKILSISIVYSNFIDFFRAIFYCFIHFVLFMVKISTTAIIKRDLPSLILYLYFLSELPKTRSAKYVQGKDSPNSFL